MAVDQFIKIGDIEGESRDHAHGGEIDVLTWDWGMSQSGTMQIGGGGGTGKVDIEDLSFTKWLDKSTPNLMLACSKGKHYPEATLTIRKAGENPLEYIIIKMQDVLISSISTGGSSSDDRISENVSLNFAKVELEYQPQKADGSKEGGPIRYGWNIEANEPL